MEGFKPSSVRVTGELAGRMRDGANSLWYHDSYLDDQLRGITPHDLVILTAGTGVGKTQKALEIALKNATGGTMPSGLVVGGVPVHYFALEAESMEIERRIKFSMLSQMVFGGGDLERYDFNYVDWRLGRQEHLCGHFNEDVDRYVQRRLSNLFTYYRAKEFDTAELTRQVMDCAKHTRLIIIDHLHYIDLDDDGNEARELAALTKEIRALALLIGRPVILVCHMRKRDQRSARLVPHSDDVHGSSNIAKIATHMVMIERCAIVDAPSWYQSPTFMHIAKDRHMGQLPIAAVVNFDVRRKSYEDRYTLGQLKKGFTEWEPFNESNRPRWARGHVTPGSANDVPRLGEHEQRKLDV